ncbi:MAG: hypothetical protein Ct9H300mP30_3320 [Methanobacteriota archaeon]|nr:MAG: hypothetical protein Ct9H300mP30_3320 [Euryarchaeota archaeon]
MVAVFFLALSFAALTSMISTVELCVRNFVDHGVDRSQAVGFTSAAIFLFGLPSAGLWILVDDSTGVAFPHFPRGPGPHLGYGLMFSGLFIAYSIWKYGWSRYKSWQNDNDVDGFDVGTTSRTASPPSATTSLTPVTTTGGLDAGGTSSCTSGSLRCLPS